MWLLIAFGSYSEANTPSGTRPLIAATFDTTVYPWWLDEKDRTYFALLAY